MDFVQETGLQVDAEYFFNYYEANGWQIGSQPIRSWKAALRAWARKAPAAPGPKLSDKEVFRQAIELLLPLCRLQSPSAAPLIFRTLIWRGDAEGRRPFFAPYNRKDWNL